MAGIGYLTMGAISTVGLRLADRWQLAGPSRPQPLCEVASPPQRPPGQRPLVTVVIVSYNYAHYLEASVGSALAQEDVDIQVVLVDNGSADDTSAVGKAIRSRDPRAEVYRLATNQRPTGGFNYGLTYAHGDYVVRLDADDLLSAGSLARAAALLEAHSSIGLVYGHPVHFFDDDIPENVRQRTSSWTVWPGRAWLKHRCMTGVNCITSPEVVMRRSVLDRVGPMRDIAHAHDLELWLRIAANSDVGHINGADQALHREHARSLSATEVDVLIDLQDRREAFDALLGAPSAEGVDVAQMHALAMRALAIEALGRACHALDRGRAARIPVDRLEAFALEVYPNIQTSGQWRAWQRRRRVGQRLTPLMPTFVFGAAMRRTRGHLSQLRWAQTGL